MRYEMSREHCANHIEREHHVSLGYVHNFFFFGLRLSHDRLTDVSVSRFVQQSDFTTTSVFISS